MIEAGGDNQLLEGGIRRVEPALGLVVTSELEQAIQNLRVRRVAVLLGPLSDTLQQWQRFHPLLPVVMEAGGGNQLLDGGIRRVEPALGLVVASELEQAFQNL